ncbi:hypothetical protein [Hyphococcus sp.]|jgi:hypothetical protein|uniref:hypothetical protein n=1 Tax=Hyphococcus sp. TaxID=2038636 RepID=UPI003D1414CA
MAFISRMIEQASWTRFFVWFVILFVFSAWAFNMDSPWTRALEAAGGVLPETKPGIPALEPVRTLDALGDDRRDYILWQLVDIPYALMNFFFASMGMGLGLKALRLDKSILRFLLVLPAIYVVCEVIENALVASFAAKIIAPAEGVVLVQQLATSLKFASGMPALLLGVLGAALAFIALLIRLIRKKT